MEIFLLLLLLIVLIITYSKLADVKQTVERQGTELGRLRTDLAAFVGQNVAPPKPAPPSAPDRPPVADAVPQPVLVPQPPTSPKPTPTVPPKPTVVIDAPSVRPVQPPTTKPPVKVPKEPQLSYFGRFLRDNPDLEKFIGENLINKIGIAILVAGIGYFVKFAIDQQWINEVGRVLIGFVAGGLLLGLAHRIRHSFAAFSSVLVAGGLSVLYFTVAIAYQEYGIFSQAVAFGLMVVITGFSILLSIAYNRVELAVMSLVGGFATPYMVSSGQGNYVVLFAYLLILDVGMLVLAYFKKWNLVHWVAYGFTVLLYGTWLSTQVLGQKDAPYAGALLFATLFYAVFIAMNLVYNLKERTPFRAVEIILLLSNTTFYYAAGMLILDYIADGAYQGLFTGALAVLNFGFAALLFRRDGVDRTLLYLLIGLVITFASLTVPVQLDGNFITMFWALEAVLLLWLAQRSGLWLVATASVVVMGLMLISLTMDWSNLYGPDDWSNLYGGTPRPPLPIIFNQAFITNLVAIAGLVATRWLLDRQETPFRLALGELAVGSYRRLLGYVTVGVVYLTGALELDYQLTAAFGYDDNRTILLGTYNLLVATALLLVARRYPAQKWLAPAFGLGLLMLGLYVVVFCPPVLDSLSAYFHGLDASLAGFWLHYLNVGGVLGILWLLTRARPRLEPLPPLLSQGWPWLLGIFIVYTVSYEVVAHVVYFGLAAMGVGQQPQQQAEIAIHYDALVEQATKVGLPIAWGLCAFVFMYVGLTRRNRPFRVLSLSLFALTLLKLFLYDIQGISEGGRIVAFILLGVLLLIVSFMYQRIKRLIIVADEPPTPNR